MWGDGVGSRGWVLRGEGSHGGPPNRGTAILCNVFKISYVCHIICTLLFTALVAPSCA